MYCQGPRMGVFLLLLVMMTMMMVTEVWQLGSLPASPEFLTGI